MPKDILFLLPPGFAANDRREYCPECAEVWGLLHYFPAIRESIDIRYQSIEKPRPEMTALLGEDHQNCPTLALDAASPGAERARVLLTPEGRRFLDNARDIGKYYAERFGTPVPRGT